MSNTILQQTTLNPFSGTTTPSVTFPGACTPGSRIIVLWGLEDGVNAPTAADGVNAGNYAQDSLAQNGITGGLARAAGSYSKDNTSSSALTVTLTLSAAVNGGLRAFELPAGATLDSHNEAVGGDINPAVTVTTTTDNCSVFSATCVYTDPGVLHDTGYTDAWAKFAGSNAYHFGQYNLDVGAAGAQALTYGVGSTASRVAIAAAAYKTAGAGTPTISSTSSATPRHGKVLVITGSNFGSTQGTKSVKVGGTTQTVVSWASGSVSVLLDRGSNAYGVAVNAEIWDAGSLASNSFALTSILPPVGWSYVNIGTPNTTSAYLLPFSPALASGDQVAYNGWRGLFTVLSDGTYLVTGGGYVAAPYEAWSPGSGWGSRATMVVFAQSTANTGLGTKGGAFGFTGWARSGLRRRMSPAQLLYPRTGVAQGAAYSIVQVASDWVFQSTVASGPTGTVSNASTATTLSTLAGTQAYAGAISPASTVTTASAPTGTQVYAGTVGDAATATTLSTLAGSSVISGAVANASTATTLGTPAGTQAANGTVADAATATSLSTPAGTQVNNGAVSAASTATTLSTPAGAQTYSGAVANAATATTLSTPAGTAATTGSVANAATATSLSTPTGSQVNAGAVSPASTATTTSAPAGTQVYTGAVSAAATATALSTPAGNAGSVGAVAAASTATSLSTPAGSQVNVGTVSAATTATVASALAGMQVYNGAVAASATATTLSTPAGAGAGTGIVSGATSSSSTSSPAGTQVYNGAVSAAASGSTLSTPSGTQLYLGIVAPAVSALQLSTPAGSTGVAGTAGLVYAAGAWQYKATPAFGDLLLFLGPDGLIHAKTAAGPGDRRLTNASGLLQAGAPA